jgi:hypothetical protein
MELFDIIKLIFSNKEKEWDTVSNYDKGRNYFMINRIMSIQYPIQANQFNKTRINPSKVVDWWHDTLSQRFKKPPSDWIFAKTNKKESDKKINFPNMEETESFIRDKYKISKRDMDEIKKFYPEEYLDWVKDISKQIFLK